jgi:hypothetical protein
MSCPGDLFSVTITTFSMSLDVLSDGTRVSAIQTLVKPWQNIDSTLPTKICLTDGEADPNNMWADR